jgi:hypothetical protein
MQFNIGFSRVPLACSGTYVIMCLYFDACYVSQKWHPLLLDDGDIVW